MIRIAIGCDHIVVELKDKLRDLLINKGYDVVDVGTYSKERTHYPIFGVKVGQELVNNNVDFGVVLCGTGVGISNAVQKIKGIRAVLVKDILAAKIARKTFDANVIGFGGNIVGIGLIEEIIDAFVNTKFSGDRKVVEYLDSLISGNNSVDYTFEKERIKWKKGVYHD